MSRLNTLGAYVATADGTVLYELVGCVHCQYKWQPKPGSGTTRGICLSCNGLLCMRSECVAEQRRHLHWAKQNGWIGEDRRCIPFEEWCHRFHDATLQHEVGGRKQGVDFQLDQSGLYLPWAAGA